jgi:hypothetical protein
MMRILTTCAVLVMSVPAHAGSPLQCKDIAKGDVAACNAKVKSQCTQAQYWDRRNCEGALVEAMDSCLNGQYEAACKAAAPLRAACDVGSTQSKSLAQYFTQAFADKYNKAKDAAVGYAKFHQQWAACYRSEFDTKVCYADDSHAEECKRAPDGFKKILAEETDEVIKNGTKEPQRGQTEAKLMLDINAKLKPELRYKEKELQHILELSAEADKKDEADRLKAIANSHCKPGGKNASAAFMKQVREFYEGFEKDGAKKHTITSVRIHGAASRYVDRERLLTVESMPAEVCGSYVEAGKKHCTAESISFYREKAPASPWTSWMIATSGVAEVSCK